MILLAINELKDNIDEGIVKKVIDLADWQLTVRRLYDPIDADSQVAKMEEKIRRLLKTYNAMTDRDLKRHAHVNKTGLWIYNTAQKNLKNAQEIIYDKKTNRWKLR